MEQHCAESQHACLTCVCVALCTVLILFVHAAVHMLPEICGFSTRGRAPLLPCGACTVVYDAARCFAVVFRFEVDGGRAVAPLSVQHRAAMHAWV